MTIGDLRCPPTHPSFADSGPAPTYCFGFPRSSCWIQHAGSCPFVADSTVVPVYNAGLPYARREIHPEGDRTDWFAVAPRILREMLVPFDAGASDADRRLFRFDYSRVGPELFLRQRQLYLHVRTATRVDALYVEESVLAALEAVLVGAYGRPRGESISGRHRDLALAAKAKLGLRFHETDSLEALAGAVGSSVFHLCRVFRRYSGSTLHGYRNELRLRRSLELLGETSMDILTIAILLGYSSHSHFTAAFHRAFGMTPSRFRATPRQLAASWRPHFPAPRRSATRRAAARRERRR